MPREAAFFMNFAWLKRGSNSDNGSCYTLKPRNPKTLHTKLEVCRHMQRILSFLGLSMLQEGMPELHERRHQQA